MIRRPRILSALILLAVLAAAGPPAFAQKKGGKDKKKPTATLKQEDFFERKELQASDKRREAIRMIKDLIAQGVSEEREKPDLYFRLAELYWEEGQYWYMMGMAVDDDKNLSRGEKKRKKRELFKKQKKYQLKGINLYKSIVENYPTYYRNDEVLFYLAQNQAEMGQETEALGNYRKLIKTFRKSRFVPDAYLSFGEYFFNHDNLDKSLRAYLKVATYKDSKVYPYALYKIGWCYFNMGYFEKALKKFERVIKLQTAGDKDQRKIALRREAIKDLVRTYAQVGEPEKARDYFERVGGAKDMVWMLEGLAEGYSAQGMDENSSAVFRVLISLDENNKKNPIYQAEIVSNTQNLGDKKRTVDEVGNLVAIYKKFQEQGHPEKVQKAIKKKVDDQVRRLTKIYHAEAQKTKNTSTYKVAFKLYELYLSLFPDSKAAGEMRFYYADLGYRLRKYQLAADEYSKVVQANCGKQLDEKMTKMQAEAAFGAVSAWERIARIKLSRMKGGKTKRKGQEYKAEPIPEAEQKLLAACGLYVKCVPKGPDALKVAYNSALIFYKRNHFGEAVKRFKFITDNHPEAKEAEYAANLILDSYNLLKDYKALNATARAFLKHPEISKKEKGKMRERLVKLIEESQFKIVEAMAKGEQGRRVAEAWLAFVKEFPKSSVGDLALYNASVHFTLDKMLDRAIETREALVKGYPKSKLLAKTTYQLATNYEQLAEWNKAAKQLEDFYKLSEKKRKSSQSKEERDVFKENADKALKRAGVYREALAQYRKAVDDCETYAKVFRKNSDSHLVYYRIAALHEKARMWKKAEEVYRKYRSFRGDPNLVLESAAKRSMMLDKRGKGRDAQKACEETVKLYNGFKKRKKNVDAGEQWAAYCAFQLAEESFRDFRKVRLTLPQKKLEKLLIKKADLLQKTEQRYKGILRYKKSDWPIAALYQIGLAYQNFAKTLKKAPVPPGLTIEQRDIYMSELENRAIPVEEKALEAFQKALAASARLNIYNEWVNRAEKKMAEVRPEDYPIDVELFYPPDYLQEGFIGAGLVEKLDPRGGKKKPPAKKKETGPKKKPEATSSLAPRAAAEGEG